MISCEPQEMLTRPTSFKALTVDLKGVASYCIKSRTRSHVRSVSSKTRCYTVVTSSSVRIVSRVVVAGVVEVTSREEEEGVTTLDTTMAVTIAVFTKAGAVVATRTNTTNSSSIRINSTVLVTCPALPSWADVSSTLAIFCRRQDGRNSRISSLGVVLWSGRGCRGY